ncbi:uncharacterized protein LOC116413465 [Galleria mellonella]|uniref:Uncharacterized protein LOC116413465 n=1 Tax=Galleria mellonella TaxID=7137 RepID=A0ABM3MNS6_GALME|nr:uncharacterized protein LOC116413465 [Galleria mellonella]
MCDVFPEFQTCCLIISLRLGMLFISVLCIMTGVTSLCAVEQNFNASFDNLKNITDIKKPEDVISRISNIISTGITTVSYLFMIGGLALFYGTISGDEGVVQIFVWLTFLGVVIAYLLITMIAVECVTQSKCLLSDMDWLSGSATLVFAASYLCVWVYFISVANSYVVLGA